MATRNIGIKGINGLPLVDEGARKQIENANLTNPFEGKKWVVFGDSISQPNTDKVDKYYHYIAKNLGMTVKSYAVGGSGYFKGASSATFDVNNIVDKISQAESEYDIVSFMAGVNERNLTLGEPTDVIPTEGNPTTCCGAVKLAIEKAIEKYPTAQIFLITPTPGTGNDATPKQGNLAKYVDKQIEIARMYNIPVLDLYHESGLRPWNTDNHAKYYRDYCHLLTGGHEYISKIIQKFMQDKLSI